MPAFDMSSDFETLPLPEGAATRYVRERLETVAPWGTLLSAEIAHHPGVATTGVPKGTDLRHVVLADGAREPPGLTRDISDRFLRDALGRLLAPAGRFLLAQDPAGYSGRPDEVRTSRRALLVEGTDHLLLWGSPRANELHGEIERVVHEAELWTFCCAVCDGWTEVETSLRRGTVSERELAWLATQAVGVAVDAYDNVGYVVWERDGRPAGRIEQA